MTPYDLICRGIVYLSLATEELEKECQRSNFQGKGQTLQEEYVQRRIALYQAQQLLSNAKEIASEFSLASMEVPDRTRLLIRESCQWPKRD